MEPLTVLHRTAHWIVVAKPPRLLVHGSRGRRAPFYAYTVLRDQLGQDVHPVHRLDRPTSGCLLFALSPEWARILQGAMGSDDAVKTYLAHVRGRWTRPSRSIEVDRPIKDDHGVLREAHTTVTCVATCADPRSSLLLARPSTGRYHQVRRHVRGLDHPVLGDSAHGDTRANRWWQQHHDLPRLALHCASLDLPLPEGARLQVQCPLFDDLHRLWSTLPWWDEAARRVDILRLSPLALPSYASAR